MILATDNCGPIRRFWGNDYAITRTIDGGRQLKVSGWGSIGARIRQGDYLTRYKVAEVEYSLDPDDMWHATLDFAPRQDIKEQQQ
ncbi:hypothetical protein [Kitasatospora sp. NPDC056731]|uniref:hypothetical protein n=1 Tax=Kitasatospora sp. NPDC056731 TaxID=3155422 RepID=UPI0034352F69